MQTHSLALEHIGASFTAPGATLQTAVAVAGDTLQVRNTANRVFLLDFWRNSIAAGITSLTSPQLRDNTSGVGRRVRSTVGNNFGLQSRPTMMEFTTQDVPLWQITGSAGAGVIESLGYLLYYENGAPAAGRYITYEEYIAGMVPNSNLTLEHSLTSGTTAAYTAETAFNAGVADNMRANTDYAITGFLSTGLLTSVVYKGPDTGLFRIGGPANNTNPNVTRDWFVNLAIAFNMPFIPVVNSANKGGTTVGLLGFQTATASVITTYLTEMK